MTNKLINYLTKLLLASVIGLTQLTYNEYIITFTNVSLV